MNLHRWNELRELLRATSTQFTVEDALSRWNESVARLINAEQTSIRLLHEPKPVDEVWADNADKPPATRHIAAPIKVADRIIGFVSMTGPRERPWFDLEDQAVIGTVALLIGQAIELAQLRSIMSSRFAQLSLLHAAGNALEQALPSVGNTPAQLARILGKSFYREMTRAGFGVNQIIDAASEIIGQVSGSLKRHRSRRLRQEAHEGQAGSA